MLLSIVISAVAATLLIGLTGLSAAEEINMARKSDLTKLVRQDCGSCHGMTMKGGLGKSLLPKDLAELTSDEISEIILDGVSGTPMPPWKGLLTEPEANWIAVQLKLGLIKKGNAQ